MIARITGTVLERTDSGFVISAGSCGYEVFVPQAVMSALRASVGSPIELVTYHYYQVDHSRSVPVLIGFENDIEKEFFEKFITVSGVGPKAACKALAISFAKIADAIDRGDIVLLKSLPGIGERRAREIVAKLQGRVGKYGLIRDRDSGIVYPERENIKEEVISVLIQLQYTKAEAKDMVEKAVSRNPALAKSEDILNEVYRGRIDGA